MTSVLKIQRQRDLATTFLQAPNENIYFYFVPTMGNNIGNYPPGYMMPLSMVPPAGTLLRDMGKTIIAPVSFSPTAAPGFFRAVQWINPTVAVSGNTFGIGGSAPRSLTAGNIGDMGYRTYYLAVIVDGTIASIDGSIATIDGIIPIAPYPPLSGQM
jgi:hypothetical protein